MNTVFVSITRLRLRSPFYLLPFLLHTVATIKQMIHHSQFIKGKTLLDKGFTFWTMTLWNNEADMRTYRNADAHKKAMPKLQHWCSEASVVHWLQANEAFPTWQEAHLRMKAEGRLSKLKHPSAKHSLEQIPAPRYSSKTERILLPKK